LLQAVSRAQPESALVIAVPGFCSLYCQALTLQLKGTRKGGLQHARAAQRGQLRGKGSIGAGEGSILTGKGSNLSAQGGKELVLEAVGAVPVATPAALVATLEQ
jgi:hypothetical protein